MTTRNPNSSSPIEMPNFYERNPGSRKYRDFDLNNLERAITAVADGTLSVHEAAEQYNIPKLTIHRKYKGQNGKNPGGQTAFTRVNEEHIINGLLISAKWRMPFTPRDVRRLVKQFLDRKGVQMNRFKNNLPGRQWLTNFLKRNKDRLTLQFCENVKRSRAQETLKDIKPENLLNYDETNVSDDPGQEKVIVFKGTKHTERVIDATERSRGFESEAGREEREESEDVLLLIWHLQSPKLKWNWQPTVLFRTPLKTAVECLPKCRIINKSKTVEIAQLTQIHLHHR
ncbi:hypothetical protein NQ315_000534 [Exocentrus adspersus]|uniref:HTH psq-type domain-containing protein n=1 Tax=Exocentrus adspersus TaxID=1586481 RepID=A0AAV8VDY3_9CUCU|nr:hypothetical protein NQ315_000534 [Exocentrus adspersus]